MFSKSDIPYLGEGAVEDDGRDILCLRDKLVHLAQEAMRWRISGALDVSAVPIVISDVDNVVVSADYLVALHQGSKFLSAHQPSVPFTTNGDGETHVRGYVLEHGGLSKAACGGEEEATECV